MTPEPNVTGLSCNQADILQHTSRTGRYCSDEEPDLIALTQRGYLRDHGAQPLAAGMHYYTMTPAGRAALNAHRLGETRPLPIPTPIPYEKDQG